MKFKITDNLFLKILSVLVAIILWMIVVNINDAERTESFNLEVALLNTEVITENGKVFWVEDGTDMVRVKVRARKSVMDGLKSSDFVLTADMEKDLKYDSMVGITVECRNKNINVDEDVSLSRSNVKVNIEDSATEQFPIRVTYTGSINDGLVVGSLVPEQTVIKVTGPVSIVEKIKKVEGVVDVTGLPGTSVRNCSLTFYDAADNELDTTYLNFAGKSEGIDVTVSMLNKKTVPLVFSYMGTPAENYEVKNVEWKPEYIEIAGNSSVLEGITSLQIPEEAVNVDGVDEELQLVVDITPYLPSGIILPDGDSASVLVIVQLEYVDPEGEEEESGKKDNDKSEENHKSEEDKKSEETDTSSKGDTTTGTTKPSGNPTDDKDISTGTENTNKDDSNTGNGTSAGTTSGENQNKNETESDKNEKPKSNS